MHDSDSVLAVKRQERRWRREASAREEAERIAMEALDRLYLQRNQLQQQAQQLRDALAELKKVDDARRELINSAAHVLRTPLTSLMIRLHSAERSSQGEVLSNVREARRIAEGVSATVNDLIRVGQLDAGHVVVNLRPVELEQVLQGDGRFAVHADGCEDCSALMDANRLTEILDIIVRYSDVGDGLQVSVISVGGIVHLRIHAPSPAASRSEWDLLGLGETLVRRLALSMGAELSIEDTPFAERVWTLRLPLA